MASANPRPISNSRQPIYPAGEKKALVEDLDPTPAILSLIIPQIDAEDFGSSQAACEFNQKQAAVAAEQGSGAHHWRRVDQWSADLRKWGFDQREAPRFYGSTRPGLPLLARRDVLS